ncbi:hypothetical protein N803_15815 [Knoellia subterranea KCTC 19937]|uniref:DUF559 domain-containing protein n=1 Tax=Knoellia subterranea KCTC 19937 TaxID=1385521 RepID=A0A0A0JJC8_9MICO|nr:hypothetical protein N803_15815 [Knoellia subterranea KCTC 19937]
MEATAADVGAERLRAGDLLVPTSGVRVLRSDEVTFESRARAFAAVLPQPFAFSHLTAARLLDLPAPRIWQPDEPLHVMRPKGTPLIVRAGVKSHRGLERRDTEFVDGLPVTDPIETWADLGSELAEDDLLAMADALLARDLARPKDLDRTAADRRTRGSAALRRCAPLARAGAASPWESKARHAFLSWGLPEPELNVDVFTPEGRWLAKPDFLWRERRIVGEYDGDQHRTNRSQWQYERERRAGLEDAGYTYVEMTSLSLVSRQHRRALRERLTRLLSE